MKLLKDIVILLLLAIIPIALTLCLMIYLNNSETLNYKKDAEEVAKPIGDPLNTSIKLECRKSNTNKHILRMSCIFLPDNYK